MQIRLTIAYFEGEKMYCLIDQLLLHIAELHKDADSAHSFSHLEAVANDVITALQSQDYNFLTSREKQALVIAAYLHEVDDEKLKLSLPGIIPEGRYPIAKALLERYSSDEEFKALALEIVSLVSTRTNHNTVVMDKWKLLVRDADRMQALGEVGIARCYDYTLTSDRPLFTTATPRCRNREELAQIATPDRFLAYRGVSNSMIDHYYDKLLHIGEIASGDEYLSQCLDEKKETIVRFVLDFGVKGDVDRAYLERLRMRYC